MNVRTLVLAIRGAGPKAEQRIKQRLRDVADQINRDAIPLGLDPGVQLEILDPGGGGGPCTPRFKGVDIEVSASGLPEAEARDDDD